MLKTVEVSGEYSSSWKWLSSTITTSVILGDTFSLEFAAITGSTKSFLIWEECGMFHFSNEEWSVWSVREDSQIDFATGNVFCNFSWGGGGGGVWHKQRNYWKNLARKEQYYRQHNFKPSKSFNRGNYTPDCRSAPFAKTVGLLA